MIKYFNNRKILLSVLILSVAVGLILLVPSIFLLLIYNKILTFQNLNSLGALTFIYLIIMLLGYFIDNLRTNIASRPGKQFTQRLQSFLLDSFPEQHQWNQQKVIQLDGFLQSPYIFYQFEIFFGFCYIIFLYFFDPYLSLYAICSASLLFILARYKASLHINEIDQQRIFQSWPFFHNLGLKDLIQKKINQPVTPQTLKPYFHRTDIIHKIKYLKFVLVSGSLVVSSLLVIQQGLNPGIMFMVMVLMSRILHPAELVASGYKIIQTQQSHLHQILNLKDFLHHTQKETKPPLSDFVKKSAFHIQDLQLFFDPRSQPIKNQFDLVLGQSYLIIGPNGSGKSTFIHTLLGSLPLKQGNVQLDNISCVSVAPTLRQQLFNYMPQQPIVSPISLQDYLTSSAPDLSLQSLEPILQNLGIHSKILSLPQQWNTSLDQLLRILSPGEIQKLKLIQASLKVKPWNFFDEPEHFLDGPGTQYLFRHFQEIRKQQSSIIMVSHKPSMMEFFDQVILIDRFSIQSPIIKEDFLKKIKIIKKPQTSKSPVSS